MDWPAPGGETGRDARRVSAAPLVIRAPNHLGDLVMSLPALEAAGEADIVLPRGLAPLLGLSTVRGTSLPFDRGPRGFLRAIRALRARRYRRGVLLPPSLSSALLFALGGVAERRGTSTDRRGPLLTDGLPRARLAGLHRSAQYHFLVTGAPPASPLIPRLEVGEYLRDRFRALLPDVNAPLVGLFPGSNAPSRRWPVTRFATLAGRLRAAGALVVVFGGPAERAVTAAVAEGGAVDLGGRTDLLLLAAGLATCELVISNDSGPLHVAAAVGTRTLSFWGAGDPAITGPPRGPHHLLRHPELFCVPCIKNVCPRSGPGSFLADAHNECLHLIDVDEADAAARTQRRAGVA
jgi:lipopolysaccharide heptosyltransferase II